MNRHSLWLVSLAIFLLANSASAEAARREIQFPDLPGYQTLKCDLHMHTVFSDGSVWPPVRMNEAWRQGLDVVAITDHIEYQPHKADVPTNHVRPYELAAGRAAETNLLLVKSSEITRDTPPGHFNALFLTDPKALDTKDFEEAMHQASLQKAFVFWNHQGWKGEEKGRWLEVHTRLFDKKEFQGMEVANGDEYFPTAHQWCLDKNLTMLGNSDIHDPDLRKASTSADHRTMTLVFAKARTQEAVKEALLQGRTAVWYQDQIIGRKEWLEPLFAASIQVAPPHLRTQDAVWVQIRNVSSADLCLQTTAKKPVQLVLPAQATTLLKIATKKPNEPIEKAYTVTNFLVAPKTGLPVTIRVPGP
ncbi:MAG: Sb-PDE family phosphodiesterase [Pirellulales bacterium]